MELNFRIFNKDGIIIPVNIGVGLDYWGLTDDETRRKFNKDTEKGIMWTHNNKEIVIEDENTSVIGSPTTDFKYVITTYLGINGKYKPPHNSIIYNLDGSIHKILEVPSLKSPLALKRLEFLNEENPPLDTAKYEGALCFSGGGGFKKLDNGKIVNFIAIDYDRELWETRILDPETGEIGDLIHYGKN